MIIVSYIIQALRGTTPLVTKYRILKTMAKKAVTEGAVADTSAAVETSDNKNITKLARKLVQAQSMRLQLEKVEAECKAQILSEMNNKSISSFEIKTSMNGRQILLKGEITQSSSSVVDTEKLCSLITKEQFQQCAKVSLKDAKEILPSALIDQCTFVKQGNPSVKLKAEGSLIVPEIQFY